MDEIQHSRSNSKFAENKDDDQIKGEYYADNEENADGDDALTHRGVETSNKFLHDVAPVVRTLHTNAHSSKRDADDEQNADDNAGGDQKTETSDKLLNVDMPVVRTFPTRRRSKANLNIESDTSDDNSKVESHRNAAERADLNFNDEDERKVVENIEYKSLNEYLNRHEHFLKCIDRTKQLSFYERKQLDRQKEDLEKLKKRLAKEVDENNRKRLYAKQKEDEISRKKCAYLKRRVEEGKLKETRKPLIQTTFHLSTEEKRSKSQTTQKTSKDNRMELFSFSAMSQPKSVVSYMSDIDSETTPRYHDIGNNLRELIVQFVEYSKRSWINE